MKIKTKEPVAILPDTLADPLFLVVDTSVNTDEFAQKGPITTGPFIVQEFKPGEQTVVVTILPPIDYFSKSLCDISTTSSIFFLSKSTISFVKYAKYSMFPFCPFIGENVRFFI